MTAKKVVQGLIITMALCLSATTGRAQDYKVFVMGGGSSLRDPKSFTEYYVDYASKYAGGGKVTVGVEAPLLKSKIFGIEGSAGFGQNNLELSYFNYNPVQVKGYGVRNNRFSGDLVAHYPGVWKGIRPYAVAGVEYDLFSPTSGAQSLAKSQGFAGGSSATLTSQGKPGFNVGGGFDMKVASKVDLRIDVRDHWTGSPTYGLPNSSTTAYLAYFPISGSAQNIEYSIGIVYHFGRKQESTPSPQTPSTQAPSTEAPSTQAPSTQAPSTQAPSTQAPSTPPPSSRHPSPDSWPDPW
jgi:opacity protein-like surface antigen